MAGNSSATIKTSARPAVVTAASRPMISTRLSMGTESRADVARQAKRDLKSCTLEAGKSEGFSRDNSVGRHTRPHPGPTAIEIRKACLKHDFSDTALEIIGTESR